jgi:hypothetical protein
MPALSIQPPYPIFTDTDGQPLENGYVWIGTANLNPITNPVAVYWDAAFTQPASQPIRTINGYLSNAGTPARLYPNATDYSILAQDKKGSTVYSAPVATAQPTYVANGVVYATSTTELATSGNLTFNGSTLAVTGQIQATSYNGGQLAGMRNKIINGAMAIDQRNAGAAQTITAGAALAYTVDRWYGYCTGANVTGQRVSGTAPNQFNYRYTGASSVTKIGHAQRIEAANSQDLAGTTATLSVDLANSLLTTVTWTAWYANTADTFGTLASPTRTQIATGTFTVNSTLTRYSTQISIPAAATTGIEVEFSVGAQTSGTWTIGRAQLEIGSVATPFEHRPYGTELQLAQRYYEVQSISSGDALLYYSSGAGNIFNGSYSYAVPKRSATTAQVLSGPTYTNCSNLVILPESTLARHRVTVTAAGGYGANAYSVGYASEL